MHLRGALDGDGSSHSVSREGDRGGYRYRPLRPSGPPGHHALSEKTDGFCIFNNVAVAAEHVIREGLVERVAIIDQDVHHGSGTREIFYDRDDVLTVNLHNNHGRPAERHTQTGRPDEVGVGAGEAYSVNALLPRGTGNQGNAQAFEEIVEPTVAEYGPDLTLVSNGLDPGRYDPIGRSIVTTSGFQGDGTVNASVGENPHGRIARGRLGR